MSFAFIQTLGGEKGAGPGQFNRPTGLCVDDTNTLMVVDTMNHRVQLLDGSGRFVHTFGTQGSDPQELNGPIDVCYLAPQFSPSSSASALLLVADGVNKRLSIWSADGRQPISQIPVASNANGVCVDLNGLVYVSVGSHVVQIFDPRHNYSLLQTLGGAGSAPGQLYNPTGLCVDDTNTLMVADHYNNRVQFFDCLELDWIGLDIMN